MQENKKVIYADDLLSTLRDDETIDGAHFKRVKQHINAAPAVDAVEVVRCKECWKSADGLCSYKLKNVPGKDFCGDGERKE